MLLPCLNLNPIFVQFLQGNLLLNYLKIFKHFYWHIQHRKVYKLQVYGLNYHKVTTYNQHQDQDRTITRTQDASCLTPHHVTTILTSKAIEEFLFIFKLYIYRILGFIFCLSQISFSISSMAHPFWYMKHVICYYCTLTFHCGNILWFIHYAIDGCILVSYCYCKKLPKLSGLKQYKIITLHWKSEVPNSPKVKVLAGLVSFGGSKKHLFLPFQRLDAAACIPWFVTPLHQGSQQCSILDSLLPTHHLTLTLLPLCD